MPSEISQKVVSLDLRTPLKDRLEIVQVKKDFVITPYRIANKLKLLQFHKINKYVNIYAILIDFYNRMQNKFP